MSSEESANKDDEEILLVKSLEWRSSDVDTMFKKLDSKTLSEKSPQSHRQSKRRVIGRVISSRPEPVAGEFPSWVFA